MGKRLDTLSWDEYFMGLAHLSALRSKDPNTQVGAAIVDENHRVVSVGYNGFPKGCSDDVFPWERDGEALHTKYFYVVHAELNAILNSPRSVAGCTIYVSLFPCNESPHQKLHLTHLFHKLPAVYHKYVTARLQK